jgi:hypothetical protein
VESHVVARLQFDPPWVALRFRRSWDEPKGRTKSLKPESLHFYSPVINWSQLCHAPGGLGSPRTLRPQPNGELLVTDGPYLETKEHVGGFWILECADIDEVLAWARKGAKACHFGVEVREIFFVPTPEKG